jgi:ankyrin repeat protein
MYTCFRKQSGVTPVHMACQSGQGELVRRLLELGAELSAVDNSGNTALHYASKGGHIDLIR